MQIVELHYQRQKACNYAKVLKRVRELLEGDEVDLHNVQASTLRDSALFIHRSHPIQYTSGALPAQTAVLDAKEKPQAKDYTKELQQSWACPEAKDLLQKSKATRMITEMMARLLPAPDRVRLFHGVLQAMVEVTKPIALVCKHSQQVVAAEAYLAACGDEPFQRPGSINVRLFNIEGTAGDMIMDTRGLDELGLPDLQCHFHDLDPNDVSRVLFNTASYLFQQGPVIESGHTVQGTTTRSKWRCQLEPALIEPKRDLLDLNPGPRYAAGKRG